MAKDVTHDIIIPKLGNGAIDCQLSQWLVAKGDYVKEGEPILILETEKTTIEIPAPADGTLSEVYVFEGEEVIESERVGIIRAESFDEDDNFGDFDDDEEEEGYDDDDEEYDDDDEDYDDEDDDYEDDDEDDDLDEEDLDS